jgi:hypothetical protein
VSPTTVNIGFAGGTINFAGGVTGLATSTNVVINGSFENFWRLYPSESTATAVANSAYGPDRWRSEFAAAGFTTQRVDTGSTFETGITSRFYATYAKTTAVGKVFIAQPIFSAHGDPLRGRTSIFQIKMKASTATTMKVAIIQLSSTGTIDIFPATLVSAFNGATVDPTLGANLAYVGTPATASVTTAWQNFSFSTTLPTASKNYVVAVFSDGDLGIGGTVSLAEAGFYDGSGSQIWMPIDPSLELRRCRFFFRRFRASAVNPTSPYAVGQSGSTTSHNFGIFYDRMRIAPAFTFSAVGTYLVRVTATSAAATAISISQVSEEFALVNVTTAAIGTAGQGAILNNNTTSTIDLNSEI